MPAIIGQGFNSVKNELKQLDIFSNLPQITSTNREFKYNSSIYKSSRDTQNNLSLNTSIKSPISEFASLKAESAYSTDANIRNNELVYVINIVSVEKRTSADFSSYNLNDDQEVKAAISLLSAAPAEFSAMYGDSFVSQIEYGVEAAIIIGISGLNAETKKQLEGNLKAALTTELSIENSHNLSRFVKEQHLQVNVQVKTNGFIPNAHPTIFNLDQIPNLDEWIGEFEGHFTELRDQNTPNILGFSTSSYRGIIPRAYEILKQNVGLRRYIAKVDACQEAIEIYKPYFTLVNTDDSRATCANLDRSSNALIIIREDLTDAHDSRDSDILIDIEKLKKIIQYLRLSYQVCK